MSKEYTAFNGDAFWNDGYVQELDMVETAVYFHYITSPRLENSGVFKEGQRMVSFYVKIDIDTVKNADAKLEKDGKIYRIGEWVIVPSSLKHQNFRNVESVKMGIYAQLRTVPQEVVTKLKEIKYGLDITILDNKEYWMRREKRIQENNSVRNSFEYKLWHKKVLERDNYTCRICGRKRHHLHVHHIKPFALYPELRIDMENGITLCNFCHKNVHKGEI